MQPNYLLIGHIAHDETPNGPKLGGTVSYAGSAAAALGMDIAIVTSARRNDVVLTALPASAQIHLIDAPESTVFVNTYVENKRHQVLRSRAIPLNLSHIPEAWRQMPLVHFGPLDDEVDPALVRAFPNSLRAATPQGWMRTWNAEGVISAKPWTAADELLPLLNVTIFSEEDIHWDSALEAHYASLSPLLIVTRAAKGCTVYQRGSEPKSIPAPAVSVIDATGAGDVFAGIFLATYQRTQDAYRAAEIATHLASCSVTRVGLDGIPSSEEIQRVMGNDHFQHGA